MLPMVGLGAAMFGGDELPIPAVAMRLLRALFPRQFLEGLRPSRAINTARLWDVRSCKPIGKPLQHDGAVFAAAFDSRGERIVTGSWDNTARIWDARTGEPIGRTPERWRRLGNGPPNWSGC
jgi:hypothetical protein